MAAGSPQLDRGALDRAVGAEDAAVSGKRPQHSVAVCALMEEAAGIGRHLFQRGVAALWTGQGGLKNDLSAVHR